MNERYFKYFESGFKVAIDRKSEEEK